MVESENGLIAHSGSSVYLLSATEEIIQFQEEIISEENASYTGPMVHITEGVMLLEIENESKPSSEKISRCTAKFVTDGDQRLE